MEFSNLSETRADGLSQSQVAEARARARAAAAISIREC